MRVGNAPVSWGIFEVAGLSADLPYPKVMDEIASAGYEGTELGPWGYYPTDAVRLREELRKRGLALASAFCPVDLTDRAHHPAATAEVLRVADLLQALGTSEVILADPQRPDRALVAGRAGPRDELSPAQWQALSAGLNEIGARLADRGMRAVFHHHVATYVETAAEIDRLLETAQPELMGLCLDTGHAAFGGADPVEILRRWGDRVRYVHLKDVDPSSLTRAREDQLDYETGVRRGVFCPLGQGMVDFAGVFGLLQRHRYDGWLIVEQDVIVDDGTGTGAATSPPSETARQSLEFVKRFL
jgi:inosose dehydratase